MSLLGDEKFNDAYFCETCNKVVGIFAIHK